MSGLLTQVNKSEYFTNRIFYKKTIIIHQYRKSYGFLNIPTFPVNGEVGDGRLLGLPVHPKFIN
jgi:hypothetical protein